jgi:hypothetical protein
VTDLSQLSVSVDPEAELLLCCARTRLEDVTAARIATLVEEHVDWTRLHRLAHQHDVVQLLYWHLKEARPGAVPHAFMQQLRHDFTSNTARNLLLTGELRTALTCFEGNGIPAIAFKGPVLAQQIYTNVALRRCTDLDILIQKRDLVRVKEVLSSIGYQPREPWKSTRGQLLIKYSCEYPFYNVANTVTIDVHWELAVRPRINVPETADLLQKALSISLLGTRLSTLSPEDLLFACCVHGTIHSWQHLSLTCDLAEIIRANTELNWDMLMHDAATLHSERMLLVGLCLATDLLGAPLPQKVLQRIRDDSSVRTFANEIERQLFRERTEPFDDLFAYRVKEHARDRVGAALWYVTIPKPEDYETLPLPAPLIKLYYVVRPVRVATRATSWARFVKRVL